MSDDLDAIRVLTRPETIKAVGVSDMTWSRLEAAGDVPPKTRLSQNRVGYRVADIKTWLDARRETNPPESKDDNWQSLGDASKRVVDRIDPNK
jgi:predicted DNA-binding transcriptional regulator AlpA